MNKRTSLDINFYSPNNLKIGILGGGQLARMLILKGHELGYQMHVLSEKNDDPAALVTPFWHKGSIHNPRDLESFFKKVNLVTFESEFLDGSLILKAQKKIKTAINIQPSVKCMQIFQDRLFQKEALLKAKIPTSEFFAVNTLEDLQSIAVKFNYKYVLKKRYGGYDGYGTFIVKSMKDHNELIPKVDFKLSYIIEKFIAFKKEVACVFFRNEFNDFYHLPLVQSQQSNSKCDWVYGPISHPQFKKVSSSVLKMLRSLDYQGALAIEFFDTGKSLLVNETAPRVHNSAHYSLNFPGLDQFTLHLRSITGWKLPQASLSGSQTHKFTSVMTNLIGSSDDVIQIPKNITGHIHWYGKSQNRQGRKMGHINYFSPKLKKNLLALALKERKKIKL